MGKIIGAGALAYEPFYSAPMAMAVAYWDNDETYGVNHSLSLPGGNPIFHNLLMERLTCAGTTRRQFLIGYKPSRVITKLNYSECG